jgi:RNA polymerase sigma-70 factor, ECF subfamily
MQSYTTDATVEANGMDDWVSLVDRIRSGDVHCTQHLYRAVAESSLTRIRRTVDHQLVQDKLHDVLVTVLEAIQLNELRDPARLMGFVSTVTRRRVAHHIRAQVASRRRLVALEPSECPAREEDSPEAAALSRERVQALNLVLQRLCPRDREILTRFYLYEQSRSQICEEMSLSATQFRLFKSRALARCSEFVRDRKPRRAAQSLAVY